MADNSTRITKLERAQEDMAATLEGVSDDVRYMRRQLDALKIEVKELPRVIVETVRESEARLRKELKDVRLELREDMEAMESRLTAAIKDLKR